MTDILIDFVYAGLAAWACTLPLELFWSTRKRRKSIPKPVYHVLYLRSLAMLSGTCFGWLLQGFPGGAIMGLGAGSLATYIVKYVKTKLKRGSELEHRETGDGLA